VARPGTRDATFTSRHFRHTAHGTCRVAVRVLTLTHRPGDSPMNILFVDDDRNRAELLTRDACRRGHISSVAYNCRTATEYANTARFDVVVINIPPDVASSGNLRAAIRHHGLSREAVLIEVLSSATAHICAEAPCPDLRVDQPVQPGQLGAFLADLLAQRGGRSPLQSFEASEPDRAIPARITGACAPIIVGRPKAEHRAAGRG
jgi:DNA-binding NtrC family response regulator